MSPTYMKTWVIPADLANTNPICSEMAAWLLAQDLSHHIFPLTLLMREAMNNAIIHGCQMDSARNVYVEFRCGENTLQLKVKDDGSGFDWHAVLQNDVVANHKENGRGLKLYELYADRIKFNECGNEVVLIRFLQNNDAQFEFLQEKSKGK